MSNTANNIQRAIDLHYLEQDIKSLERLKQKGEKQYNGKPIESKIRSLKRIKTQLSCKK